MTDDVFPREIESRRRMHSRLVKAGYFRYRRADRRAGKWMDPYGFTSDGFSSTVLSLCRSVGRSFTHRTPKTFSCVSVYARLFLAACAQLLPFDVSPYIPADCARTRNVYNSTTGSPVFCIRTEHRCTCVCTRIRVRARECIRRGYVRAHAKERSCSIAERFDHVRRIWRVLCRRNDIRG